MFLQGEKLLSLASAVDAATGNRPHAATLHRWRIRGIAGVRLETTCLGGKRMTSVEAVRRFCDQVAAAKDGEAPAQGHAETNRESEARSTRTDAGLAKHGV